MNYELTNILNPDSQAWAQQKARIEAGKKKVLSLTSSPRFFGLLQSEKVAGVNLLDSVTGRKYQKNKTRFFNDVPVPYGAQVAMNADGSISVIYDGDELGKVHLYGNTRRAVQDVRYTNPDGTMDNIIEFAFDGNEFSNIFYYNDEIQEIVFLNNDGQAVVRYYYYGGAINYITVEDPKTHKMIKDYTTLTEFYADQLAKLLKPKDKVTISYLGIELDVLAQTKSHNIINLAEDPFDENDNVRGNLLSILNDDISYIQEVQVSQENADKLKQKQISLAKVTVV